MTDGAAGMDLLAAVEEEVLLPAGEYALIPTGIAIALPVGFEAQIRPRSGLAAKFGVTVLNAPGTIDQDYRGEIKVLLINHGRDGFQIKRGDRIAQLVVAPVVRSTWLPVPTWKRPDAERAVLAIPGGVERGGSFALFQGCGNNKINKADEQRG